MAEKKKLSVAEILAAARKMDAGRKHGGGGAAASGASEQPASAAASEPSPPAAAHVEPVAQAEPAAQQPVAESAAGGTPGGAAAASAGARPSTAEILKMARMGGAAKAAGQAPASAEPSAKGPAAEGKVPAPAGQAKSAEAKPAAAAKAAGPAKAAAATKEAPGSTAAKDTTSFLAPHKPVKRGPISKAEAAARQPATTAEGAAKEGPAREKPAKAKGAVVVPPMPPKPAYAQPKPAATPEGETRRSFLLGVVMATVGSFLALGFSTLTATLALWTLGVARFMFPNVLTEPPSRFKVGFPSDFPPGYVDERFKAQFGVWVVNGEYQGQRQIYALRTVCTHLGCTPNWLEAEQKFKCPCHGSGFYKDGINFEGPAPRPLERYAIRLADDGQLEIDKSKLFQEELGQWADPASYVSV